MSSARPPDSTSPALPPAVVALLDPAIYPHPVEHVELVQTHISYVLLAGQYVYKVKKPVDFGFLNFSTLRRRRYYCRQEIVLNGRLCPGVYLAVVPIVQVGDRIALGRGGRQPRQARVIEYAVQMCRLPADRMMDHLLAADAVTVEMVAALARRVAAFHAASARGPEIDRYGSPRAIAANWEENFVQAAPYVGRTLTAHQDGLLRDYVAFFLRREAALLRERVRAGHVRDCHGDLRTSAVCFTDPICIYDCIEFNRRFRYSDVAAEVAFLVMDLDRRGHHALADAFVEHYCAASGDTGLPALLDFYVCYRAFVRGKVANFRLDQPEVSPDERAESYAIATQAFDLACRYATRTRPLLLITCGFSGSGKSALAERLAAELGLLTIASDRVRKELAGIPPTERRRGPHDTGIYAPAFSARTYATMLDLARAALASGQSVLLDATFSLKSSRSQARAVAEETGALFACLECIATDATIRARLAARASDPTSVSDADLETYVHQRRTFEPVNELPAWQHLRIGLDADLDRAVASTLATLRERFPGAL
jgi:aminoglycoside phosphotransferase family enzyme/predicted kinase